MSKIAITYGDFDCLNSSHFHLIKEMRKIVLPNNKVAVVIPDDYPIFVNRGYFPLQKLDHRIRNLSYLVKDIYNNFSTDPSKLFEWHIQEAKKENIRLVYVGYEDEKDFPGKKILQDNKITLRFIKRPYGTNQKAENN